MFTNKYVFLFIILFTNLFAILQTKFKMYRELYNKKEKIYLNSNKFSLKYKRNFMHR